MKNISLVQHQGSCSVILAASLNDLFPKAKEINFQATHKCFFCDFVLPFPFEKEMLSILEERMRDWIKKDLPFRQLEMVPSNAAQFLSHHGNKEAAQAVLHEEDLVSLIQLDRFAGQAPGVPLDSTGEVKFFKLVEAKIYGSWIRLIGTASFSKEELKSGVQECKQLRSHLTLAEGLNLLMPVVDWVGEWIWLPRGEEVKKRIIATVLKNFPYVDQITTTAQNEEQLDLCHTSYFKKTGRGSCEVIKISLSSPGKELFNPGASNVLRLFWRAGTEETMISFLQNIVQLLKILTFDFEVVSAGRNGQLLREAIKKMDLKCTTEKAERPSLQFRVRDALGRVWICSHLRYEEKTQKLEFSLSLECLMALLLEKTEGKFSF